MVPAVVGGDNLHALNCEKPLLLVSVDWPENVGRRLTVAENREGEEHGEIDDVNYRRPCLSAAPQRRVFFRDVKPYEVRERLDALKGPISGVFPAGPTRHSPSPVVPTIALTKRPVPARQPQ